MIRIANARRATAAGGECVADLLIDGDHIAAADSNRHLVTAEYDAEGLLLLPGIVDLHGDAFERQIMPRPNVFFPMIAALLETDRQLSANGITTAFHGVTCSWEPGLRSLASAWQIMESLEAVRSQFCCDNLLHLRFELSNRPGFSMAKEWLLSGRVHLLSFNDHDTRLRRKMKNPSSAAPIMARTGLAVDELAIMLDDLPGEEEKQMMLEELAEICRDREIPMASHDDGAPELREAFHRLGCMICEFPENRETARRARDLDDHVVMGAPNILRGGSHLGLVSARELVEEGLCAVLSSDYYYPSLLAAPFILARQGAMSLAAAWELVSWNPARAAGLHDRGVLAEGKRADLLLVDDTLPDNPRVVALFRGGEAKLLLDAGRYRCRLRSF